MRCRCKRMSTGSTRWKDEWVFIHSHDVNEGEDILLELQGCEKQGVLDGMKEWGRVHKPSLIILLEPRIGGEVADEVCRKQGKTHWIRAKAIGF